MTKDQIDTLKGIDDDTVPEPRELEAIAAAVELAERCRWRKASDERPAPGEPMKEREGCP